MAGQEKIATLEPVAVVTMDTVSQVFVNVTLDGKAWNVLIKLHV